MIKKVSMFFSLVVLFGTATNLYAQEAPEPTKEHKNLTASVGNWSAKAKMWLPGSEDAVESVGFETVTSECGGMWIRTSFNGEFAGMKFQGIGMTTYDSIKKKYTGTWGDNLTPGAGSLVGTYDEKTKTMTYMVTGFDPQEGKVVTNKQTEQHIDQDHRVMKMYRGEKVVLEINYTRTKGSALKNRIMNKLEEGAKNLDVDDLKKGVKDKMNKLKGKFNLDSFKKKIKK